ncbi:hypothetical protein [Streptosporangium lutulentum]|uniref:Uncharacterized protein n=1 Tax=Streptosporangium lutulentum TaxID=1461250 RepID=A0ABT9QMA6_9ACTN|nr:hypothetical protein [Streptosporangium lutulentum]MDP9847890.1 hypothetical protein [Streptosporangium lutulentum]
MTSDSGKPVDPASLPEVPFALPGPLRTPVARERFHVIADLCAD